MDLLGEQEMSKGGKVFDNIVGRETPAPMRRRPTPRTAVSVQFCCCDYASFILLFSQIGTPENK
jgi:hypothetical protein